MDIILAGPGRAGTSVCLAAKRAGHRIVAVAGRTPKRVDEAASLLGADPLPLTNALPHADLLVVAVRDDAIYEVAMALSVHAPSVQGAVHLSGLTPVDALSPLRDEGLQIGALHPLQTMPSPEVGAAALEGAWIAVTAPDERLEHLLEEFARSIGARPFALEEAARAVYHAAAATAANATVAVLHVAAALFQAADVPFDAARPLVEAVVSNAFLLGPDAALTGPITRGDVGTVMAQMNAVAAQAPEELERFVQLGRLIADIAGVEEVPWKS